MMRDGPNSDKCGSARLKLSHYTPLALVVVERWGRGRERKSFLTEIWKRLLLSR